MTWFQSQKLGMWPLLSRAGLIDFRGGTMQYGATFQNSNANLLNKLNTLNFYIKIPD